ncbi:muscarinic receptor 5B subtype [Penaeus vannamei]|uniref:Muscarinic receptor 5B subtype n=1 Tax=Penaeus vannamei TaxID=6689 RepID=A0A3R7SLT4_PENVA|nr:muscarinic receptor 5B subtype [Penaeus vannamei]
MLTSPGHADATMNGSEHPRPFEVADVGAANETGSLAATNVSFALTPAPSAGWAAVTLATLQVGVFVVGVLGNVSVAASVWRRGTGGQQQPGSHRHSLLLSLALADLLVSVLCLPAAAVRLLALAWAAPPVLCPLLPAAQNTAHAASTLSLALLALDRYLSVRRPSWPARVRAHRPPAGAAVAAGGAGGAAPRPGVPRAAPGRHLRRGVAGALAQDRLPRGRGARGARAALRRRRAVPRRRGRVAAAPRPGGHPAEPAAAAGDHHGARLQRGRRQQPQDRGGGVERRTRTRRRTSAPPWASARPPCRPRATPAAAGGRSRRPGPPRP